MAAMQSSERWSRRRQESVDRLYARSGSIQVTASYGGELTGGSCLNRGDHHGSGGERYCGNGGHGYGVFGETEARALPSGKVRRDTSGSWVPTAAGVPTNCSTIVLNKSPERNGDFCSLSKIHFPKFQGDYPQIWKAKCLEYFRNYNISKCMWVIAVSMHLEGMAEHWWKMYKSQHGLGSWNQFIQAVEEEFDTHEYQQARTEKLSLRQKDIMTQEMVQVRQEQTTFVTSATSMCVVHELFDEMLPSAVVWDEDIGHDVNCRGGLLDQLAQGGEYRLDMDSLHEHGLELQGCYSCGEQVEPSSVLSESTALEVLDKMPLENEVSDTSEQAAFMASVVWDEELSSDDNTHGSLLQQIASGKEYLSSEENAINLIDNNILTTVDVSSLSHLEVADISFVVEEMPPWRRYTFSCGKCTTEAGVGQWGTVKQPVLQQLPAWTHGGFSPGGSRHQLDLYMAAMRQWDPGILRPNMHAKSDMAVISFMRVFFVDTNLMYMEYESLHISSRQWDPGIFWSILENIAARIDIAFSSVQIVRGSEHLTLLVLQMIHATDLRKFELDKMTLRQAS